MGTVRSYRVTPSLWLGEPPMCGALEVSSEREALEIIRAGGKACLPRGEWATAFNVLRALGVDETTALERIHFAQTGEYPATA